MARKVRSGSSTRSDSLLRYLQRTGMARGVLGTSRGWMWVFVASFAFRRLRRAIGSEPELVFRGELKPGRGFSIDHLAETYGGRRVRVRRR